MVLIDRDQASADKGKAHSDKLMTDQVDQGPRQRSRARRRSSARITPTPDYGALKDCDLVIEAVFEDRKVKAEAIAKAEAVIGDGRGVRLQHLDLADHFARAGVEAAGAVSSACISSRRSSA